MEISDIHTGLCRICIENSGIVFLDELVDDTPIYDVIMDIFSIKMSKDKNYSESICDICYGLISSSYEFKQRISKADGIWKTFCESFDAKEKDERKCGVIYELKVERIDNIYGENDFHEEDEETIIPDVRSKDELKESILSTKIEILQNKKDTYHCNMCNKSCGSAIDLHRHRQMHNGEICEICKKLFTSKLYLKIHMRTHLPDAERTINCEKCDKQFRTKTAYRMHLKHHNGVKDISCSMCEKLFYHRRDLARHMRTLHLEIKNYSCKICYKKFSNSGNLYTHMRVHTGEKPYKCKYCDCKFNQSSPLNKHMEKHILKGDLLKPIRQNE